jgi:hypothetical protein
MGKAKIRKFKWFWAWQDEAEETWLRDMSRQGWHLSSVGIPTIYDFVSGEPEDLVYRLDYQSNPRLGKEEYLQLFNDAGWEHIGEMSGWQYFRQKAQIGEQQEIYTDAESKIGKYQQALVFAGILMLPLLVALINLRNPPYSAISMLRVFIILLFALYVFVVIKILLRINQLKRL